MSIGSELYRLRMERRLSQTDVSKGLDGKIAQSTIAFYELGKRTPSMGNLRLLADFYQVPVSTLLNESNPSDEEIASTMLDLMHRDPAYRTLFDASTKLRPDDLDPVISIMQTISKRREEP